MELGVRYDHMLEQIFISTEVGRVLRPLIIADGGISNFKDEHLVLLENNEISWQDLINKGIIEYIDTAEEENALVALTRRV